MIDSITPTDTPIAARLVSVDETSCYFIDESDAPFIAAIRGIYLYDASQLTHCCELTPSYWLVHLYSTVDLTPAADKLTDEQIAELVERYELHGDQWSDCYMHCADVKRLPDRVTYDARDWLPFDDETREEAFEGLREYYSANRYL